MADYKEEELERRLGEEESYEEIRLEKKERALKEKRREEEDARIEVERIIEESSGDVYDYELVDLAKVADTKSPLNPATFENIQATYELESKFTRAVPTSSTNAPRYISLQAYNNLALNDSIGSPHASETGLVIKVTKKPSTGVGWDPVASIQDVTTYTSIFTKATNGVLSSQVVNSTSTSDHHILEYRRDAFNTASSAYQYSSKSGMISMSIKVIFQSGHEEIFTIKAPIGTRYANAGPDSLAYVGGGAIGTSQFNQEINKCDQRNTTTSFYSQGINVLGTGQALHGTYGILTQYKPVVNPGGLIDDVSLFTDYTSPGYYTGAETYFIQPTWAAHGDPLEQIQATAGLTIIDDTQSAKQEIHRIDTLLQNHTNTYWGTIAGKSSSWYSTNFTNYTPAPNTYYNIGTSISSFNNTVNIINTQNKNQLFTYTVYYSENIQSCSQVTSYEYPVCHEAGNPSHFTTTGLDCNGNTIPTAHLPGGSIYQTGVVSFIPSECCDTCTLGINVQSTPSDYGANNGSISWNVYDLNGSPTGTAFGSNGLYTLTITAANGSSLTGTAAPAGGANFSVATTVNDTAGTANTFTVSSNSQIVPGMKIISGHTFYTAASGGSTVTAYVGSVIAGNLSNNATQFYLVDSVGNPVYSQSDATPTLVFGTGYQGEFGALAPNTNANPYYEVCVTDADGCQECILTTIKEGERKSGCTDSTAINYDSTAIVDDGSCMLCQLSDGLLHDPSGSATTGLFDNFQATSTSATHNSGYGSATTHNSDGTLSVSANVISSVVGYLVWDSDSKFEILVYKTVNFNDASTAAGATLVQTINAGTLNNVSNAAATITGLAYGNYTLRFRYVDDSLTSTLENCWSEWSTRVRADVCKDQTNANYMSVPSDPYLRNTVTWLCADPPCCSLSLGTTGTTCAPRLEALIACDPKRVVNSLDVYHSTDGSNFNLISQQTVGAVSTTQSIILGANGQLFQVFGTGYYKIEINATTVGTVPQTTCISEYTQYFEYPITGCTDSTAINYDSNAICPGPCIYESFDCDGQGNCYDPGTGNGQYTSETDCQKECPVPVNYGCTDPCAANYDPSANTDNGSCTYKACLDHNATNQYWSCDCNAVKLNATINDQKCCITPCPNPETITVTTTNTTNTCTTYNNDGSAFVTFSNTNAALSWTFDIYDSLGTSFIVSVPNTGSSTSYSSTTTTSNTYSTLVSGVYTALITTSFGCTYTEQFTIGSTGPDSGCTDPAADNYDPSAVCDDGTCYICGCPDPNANNYNPNATSICECEYDIDGATPCVPDNALQFISKVRGCLTLKGSDWLHDYKLGRASDCPIMDKWKLILIEYLLTQDKEGIDCLYNCADLSVESPKYNMTQSCTDLWIQGGPSTGINHDANHKGAYLQSGGGTVVTSYDGYPNGWFGYVDPGQGPNVVHPLYTGAAKSNLTYVGDVIKWDLPINHPLASTLNGTIWELTLVPPVDGWNFTGNHQGCTNEKITHYTKCGEYTKIDVTETTNYYEKFLNFVNKFCKDCNISIL